jgi:hypothetical protein
MTTVIYEVAEHEGRVGVIGQTQKSKADANPRKQEVGQPAQFHFVAML